MTDIAVRCPSGEADLSRYAEIAAQAFVFPVEQARANMGLARRENLRIVTVDRQIAGGAILIPVRQWHHGRPVRFVGVACVAIAPEYRGVGAARTLMDSMVREMHADGVPLSGLYPSTETLYRRSGYERAGVEYRASLDAARLPDLDGSLRVRPITAADLPAVDELWRETVSAHNGQLEHNDYLSVRNRNPGGKVVPGFLFVGDEEAEGYVYLSPKRKGRGADILVTEFALKTPAAARTALALFRGHRTTIERILIALGPTHPLLGQLPEQVYTLEMEAHWMLRLNDVGLALTARGYPPGLAAELHLDVADDVVPENAGRLVLSVGSGRARVEPGGDGSVRIDVRALASLYSGFRTAADLARADLVQASDDDLAAVSAVFAGPSPYMADAF